MDLVECLGVEGRLDEMEGILEMAPLSAVGWGASVELIGLGCFTDFAAPYQLLLECGHTHHWCNRQH